MAECATVVTEDPHLIRDSLSGPRRPATDTPKWVCIQVTCSKGSKAPGVYVIREEQFDLDLDQGTCTPRVEPIANRAACMTFTRRWTHTRARKQIARLFTSAIEHTLVAQYTARPHEPPVMLCIGLDGFTCSMPNFAIWVHSLPFPLEFVVVASMEDTVYMVEEGEMVIHPSNDGEQSTWHKVERKVDVSWTRELVNVAFTGGGGVLGFSIGKRFPEMPAIFTPVVVCLMASIGLFLVLLKKNKAAVRMLQITYRIISTPVEAHVEEISKSTCPFSELLLLLPTT